ncbi:MAG: GrpB family protein [Syntrophomonadaceae bacterium]|nr:GrpB family protein [Syntrophomonadaceae bacterium]
MYRLIYPSEYGVLETFLYESIFIPEGVSPPSREVIYEPSLYHYIEGFGRQGDVCFACENDGKIVGIAWSRILGYETIKEQDTDYIMVKRLDGKETVAFGLTLEELWHLFPIELTEHNPAWAEWYEDEKSALLAILGDLVKRIDHIGSTSVNGIIAKPIVDILLQVAPDCDVDWLKSVLSDNGWQLMSEQTTPDVRLDWNQGYTAEGFAERVFHLHVRQIGDWDELYFHDYIDTHPAEAAEYESLKRELAITHKNNRDAYTEAKGNFIKSCTEKARAEKGQE